MPFAIIGNTEVTVNNVTGLLNSNGKIESSLIDSLYITSTTVVTNNTQRDNLVDTKEGDVVVVTDDNKTYIKDSGSNWIELKFPVSLFATPYTIYVDCHYSGTPDGSSNKPYATIQAALNTIPSATNATEMKNEYIIHIESGEYNEDISFDYSRKKVILLCKGRVDIGSFNSSSMAPSVAVARNITLSASQSSINSIRPSFSIISQTIMNNTGTHQLYEKACRISGSIILSSSISLSSEISLNGVGLFAYDSSYGNGYNPSINSSGYSGNLNCYMRSCRLYGTIIGSLRIQNAFNCTFEKLLTVAIYSRIEGCVIGAGMTYTVNPTNAEVEPVGIFHSKLVGAFTCTGLNLVLDAYSYNSFVSNSCTCSGNIMISEKVAMNNISDYQASGTVSDSQALVYNGTLTKWQNKTLDTSSISGLTDALKNAIYISLDGYESLVSDPNSYLHGNTAKYGDILRNDSPYSELRTMIYTTDYTGGNPAWRTIKTSLNSYELRDFSGIDALYTGILNGDVLTFNATTKKWYPAAASAGATQLSALTDCQITSPTNTQVLSYNGSKWVNSTISSGSSTLATLTDVTITSVANMQVLSYNSSSSKWVNSAHAISTLSDVAISSIANNQFLQYNSTASKWNNATITTDNIPQGSTNLYFTNSYKNTVDSLNNLSNCTYTFSDLQAGVNSSPIYSDESSKPVLMVYTPNSQYNLVTNPSIVYSGGQAQLVNGPVLTIFKSFDPYKYLTFRYSLASMMSDGGSGKALRINFDLLAGYQLTAVKYLFQTYNGGYFTHMDIYGSNDVNDFNNITSVAMISATLVHGTSISVGGFISTNIVEKSFAISSPFRFVSVILTQWTGSTSAEHMISGLDFKLADSSTGGTYVSIFEPSDFTISSDTNGYPQVNRSTGTGAVVCSFSNLLVFEAYRRIFPVIRDTNDIRIGGTWKVYNNVSTLAFNNGSDRVKIGSAGTITVNNLVNFNDSSLVTHVNPMYNTMFIAVSQLTPSDGTGIDKAYFGCLKLSINDRVMSVLQMPTNYKQLTDVVITFIFEADAITMGYFANNFNYAWKSRLSNTVSILVMSNEAQITSGSTGARWGVSYTIPNNSESLPLSTIQWQFQRVTPSGSPSYNSVPYLVGCEIRYQISSFATLS